MSWFKVSLTNEQVAEENLIKLQENFMRLYRENYAPEGMALFSGKPELEDNQLIHPVYFSPASVQFAQTLIYSYSGTPCEQPGEEDMSLLVGRRSDFDLLR
jgi:hypothetical protein